MKSLDELRRVAMNVGEIEKNVKVLVREIEEKIVMGMQKGLSRVKIFLSNCDYQFIACDGNHGVKIILYNLLEILNSKSYTVRVAEDEGGYTVYIDISKNKKEIQLLDAYINKYKF